MLFRTPLSIISLVLTTILAVSASPFPRSGSTMDIERRTRTPRAGGGTTIWVIEKSVKIYDKDMQQGSAVVFNQAAYFLEKEGDQFIVKVKSEKTPISKLQTNPHVHSIGSIILSPENRAELVHAIKTMRPNSIINFKELVLQALRKIEPGAKLQAEDGWFGAEAAVGSAGTSAASESTGKGSARTSIAIPELLNAPGSPPAGPSGSNTGKMGINAVLNPSGSHAGPSGS
ncbi:hypothetical protein D9757_008840 [Collybiopsis confluens]|uniref:Uncharacterized protein n=1 Tax=Collybiopsis confluens TaxID=2823264 RepID=A0A8H5M052_9AGAR|nr:hypothetical protein D9757_008840 [Collybiopsis confluens]